MLYVAGDSVDDSPFERAAAEFLQAGLGNAVVRDMKNSTISTYLEVAGMDFIVFLFKCMNYVAGCSY